MKKRFIEAVSQRARIFSLALVFAMVIQSFGIVPKVYADNVNLDISEGNIIITDSGYTVGDVTTTLSVDTYVISSSKGSDESVANTITVQSGTHNITLDGVNIISSSSASPFSILAGAVVNLTIKGTNTLESTVQYYSGIAVPANATLTITNDSSGSLSAIGGDDGAGIGGGINENGGTVIVDGGVIEATGGNRAAGIGGGHFGVGGDVKIKAGTVIATSGAYGAGIGGGNTKGGGDVMVSGGTVTARSVGYGAGIGGGNQGDGGNVVITSGTVIASSDEKGAGIGGGNGGAGGTVEINGGKVTATSADSGAGIGGGDYQSGNSVTINGGKVEATSGKSGAGIGGGLSGNGGAIEITGGTVEAKGGPKAAAVGGGEWVAFFGGGGGTISITGGTVTAVDGNGIGDGVNGSGGKFSTSNTGNAFIVAKTISDTSGQGSSWSGAIIIGDEGEVYGSTVTLGENAKIPSGKTLTIGEDKELVVGTDVTLANSGSLINKGTLTNNGELENSGTLTNSGKLTDDGTLTNSGTIDMPDYEGTIDTDDYASRFSGEGTLEGGGEYKITNIDIIADYIKINTAGLKYTGSDLSGEIQLTVPDVKIMERTFTAEFTNWNTNAAFYKVADDGTKGERMSEVIDVGGYIVEYTTTDDSDRVVSKSFSVGTNIPNLEDTDLDITATYGQMLKDLTLPTPKTEDGTDELTGRWEWTKDDTTPVGNAGDRTGFEATFIPDGEQGYAPLIVTFYVTVLPADAELSMSGELTAEYGEKLETVSLPDGWAWNDGTTYVGNRGDNPFAATYTPEDTKNYDWTKVDGWDETSKSVKTDLLVAVSQAQNKWTELIDITGWTYGEAANQPTAVAKFGTVEFVYSDSEDGTYTKTAPTTAGTWYVKAIVEEDYNYSGLISVSQVFTISQAKPNYGAPEGLTAEYGEKLETVSLPDGWAWNDGTTYVGNRGDNPFAATYTPEDTKNYDWTEVPGWDETSKSVKTDLLVAVSQAQNKWTELIDITGWTYGEAANQPTAVAKFGTVEFVYSDSEDGTYTKTAPTTAGTWYVKAIVEGNDNYTSLTSNPIEYAILQAMPSYNVSENLTAIYGQTLENVSMPDADNGTWSWDDTTVSVGEAGTHTFADTDSSTGSVNDSESGSGSNSGDGDEYLELYEDFDDDDETQGIATNDVTTYRFILLALLASFVSSGIIVTTKRRRASGK